MIQVPLWLLLVLVMLSTLGVFMLGVIWARSKKSIDQEYADTVAEAKLYATRIAELVKEKNELSTSLDQTRTTILNSILENK